MMKDSVGIIKKSTAGEKVENKNSRGKDDSFLEDILKSHPDFFANILQNLHRNNVQIIYTQIDRDLNNHPHFRDYYFHQDSGKYFYPASTVKLPTVILALQKLNELKHFGITKSSPMITGQGYSGQTSVYNDPQMENGIPSIAGYIKKIFLVSDNDAFNRLYEFLGPEYINLELHKRGYDDVQIIHRLEVSLNEDQNRHTNAIEFPDNNGTILYNQPMQNDLTVYEQRQDTLGSGYYSKGKMFDNPMDFSKKNRISLQDLHLILRSIIFPESVEGDKKFGLEAEDYSFLYHYMSAYPAESDHPSYDAKEYWNAYAKFLLHGSDKKALPNNNIRIFNKVGDAYGQMIDIAYIIDIETKTEFFLSAAINCNTNEILNDDTYDYDTIGLPFMKHLGEVILNHELKRSRAIIPDLSNFLIDYSIANQ